MARISEIVRDLTDTLVRSGVRLSPAQLRFVDVLRDLRAYSEREQSLVEWDQDLRGEIDGIDQTQESGRLIELIYELAVDNLYKRFDENGTKQLYEFLVTRFAQAGITIRPIDGIDDW